MDKTIAKLNVVVTCPGDLAASEVARIFKRVVEAGINEMHERDLDWQNILGTLDVDSRIARDMTVEVEEER